MAKSAPKRSGNKNKTQSPVNSGENNFGSLEIEEAVYITQLTRKYLNRPAYKPHDPKKIYSYIPGTVLEIFIKPGDELQEGDPLIILEAMKMRNIITVNVSGRIKAVHVKAGEIVPKNQIIVELE
jgi:biotin carboxyl carrier protein